MAVPNVVQKDIHGFFSWVVVPDFSKKGSHHGTVAVPFGGENGRLARRGVDSANDRQSFSTAIGDDRFRANSALDLPIVAVLYIVHLMDRIEE